VSRRNSSSGGGGGGGRSSSSSSIADGGSEGFVTRKRKRGRGSDLDKHEVVVASYDTVLRCDRVCGRMWYRVVLDEAHLIRNPESKKTKRVLQLRARCKLCLTGTPVCVLIRLAPPCPLCMHVLVPILLRLL
jgi:SNF2 family DNA or RNA helicase